MSLAILARKHNEKRCQGKCFYQAMTNRGLLEEVKEG